MMHGHKCGSCGRTWQHDPLDWINRPELASSRAMNEHAVREHTCCGQLWIGHWPPPWPLRVLGADLYDRALRAALVAAHLAAIFRAAFRVERARAEREAARTGRAS